MPDAERLQRVDDGVHHRRGRADRAGLARALHAQRVARRRRHSVIGLDHGQEVRLGQRVLHQRARDQVAALVVVRALPQRLGRALDDAAVQLSVDDQRVDRVADVVDGDVALERHRAGRGVDLDHGDVRAERIRAVRRIVVGGVVEEGLHALRQAVSQRGGAGHLLDRLGLVGRAAQADADAPRGPETPARRPREPLMTNPPSASTPSGRNRRPPWPSGRRTKVRPRTASRAPTRRPASSRRMSLRIVTLAT